MAVGWYGPELMSALFVGGKTDSTQQRRARADSGDHVTKSERIPPPPSVRSNNVL